MSSGNSSVHSVGSAKKDERLQTQSTLSAVEPVSPTLRKNSFRPSSSPMKTGIMPEINKRKLLESIK